MPFWMSPAFLSGRITVVKTLGSVQDYNLWLDSASPTQPADIFVFVQPGAYLDTFIVGNFHPASILTIQTVGGGAGLFYIRGRGGNGGGGGAGESSNDIGDFIAFPGETGNSGGTALSNTPGIEIRINADDAYIFGGGGGGGGGACGGSYPASIGVTAGGGGGGGQGWNTSVGGFGGEASPFDTASYVDGDPGLSGGSGSAGTGGAGGDDGTYQGGDGGNGGAWGAAGSAGGSSTHLEGGPSGSAGAAGKAIDLNGGSLVLLGAKNEATLISESRLRGAVS